MTKDKWIAIGWAVFLLASGLGCILIGGPYWWGTTHNFDGIRFILVGPLGVGLVAGAMLVAVPGLNHCPGDEWGD